MTQGADGGSDDIENAIPLCFDCHAEVHAYNPKHPKGRKLTTAELRLHKEQWLALCRDHPEMFDTATQRSDAGPIHAVQDELEYNLEISRAATDPQRDHVQTPFIDEHFRRAMTLGALSMLDQDLKEALMHAYIEMGTVNQHRAKAVQSGQAFSYADIHGNTLAANTVKPIALALARLRAFLAPNDESISEN